MLSRLWQKVIVGIFILGFIANTSHRFFTTSAQDGATPSLLVSGVDQNGQGFPIAVVDLKTGVARTLATFARQPLCPPSVFAQGSALLYELLDAALPSPYVYHIDVASATRTTLLTDNPNRLQCPVVSPSGHHIAWLRFSEDGMFTDLWITDASGGNERLLATHSAIFDVVWSPGGNSLVYSVTEAPTPYPVLYNIPITGDSPPRLFWQPTQGLVIEYEWIPDSSGLLVAYLTDEYAALTSLSTACVIGPGESCRVEPLASFPSPTTIDLLNSYSPSSDYLVLSLDFDLDQDSTTRYTELWLIDLAGQLPPQQLTFAPELLKTSARWSPDGKEIYFIGSTLNPVLGEFTGSIYAILADGSSQRPEIRFESEIFSPAAILWVYPP